MMDLYATDKKRMLSVTEAAQYLGVSPSALRHWSDEGCVPVFRTPGNQRRYRANDLRRFITSMRDAEQAAPSGQAIQEEDVQGWKAA